MAKKLTYKELTGRQAEDIKKQLTELTGDLQSLRFKVAASDLKDVRSIRKLKRTIALLKTYLNNL
ncbi:MAG: 50S ribosomal protein L29 [Patescibacteria group bacterium]